MDDQGLSAALLPCPCCGQPAVLHTSEKPGGYGYHMHWVKCSGGDDGCSIQTDYVRFAKNAIECWNTRSPPPGDVREGAARLIDPSGWAFADEERRDFPADPRSQIYETPRLLKSLATADAILALSASPIQGGGWRPIEEAPAENALLYWPETNTLCARWSIGFPHDHGAHRSPSHFWPLPAPPVPADGA